MKSLYIIISFIVFLSSTFASECVFTFYKIPVVLKGEINQAFINKAFADSLEKSNYELLSNVFLKCDDGNPASVSKTTEVRCNESTDKNGAPVDFISFDTGFFCEISPQIDKDGRLLSLAINARNIERPIEQGTQPPSTRPQLKQSSINTKMFPKLDTSILLLPLLSNNTKDKSEFFIIMMIKESGK